MVFATAGFSHAAGGNKTLYVATNGSDSNNVSYSHPWKTINYAANNKYGITLHTGVKDLANNSLAIWSSSFTLDITRPNVTSIYPVNGAVINNVSKVVMIMFSEPIKMGSGKIEFKTNLGTSVSFNTSIVGNRLTLIPTSTLNNSKYSIILHTGSVKDLAGNSLPLWGSNFTITTGLNANYPSSTG